jgi:hypothetical protein
VCAHVHVWFFNSLLTVSVWWTSNTRTIQFSSPLNVFDNGAVLLRSVIWTLSIVLMFFNHNVSRDGSSLILQFHIVTDLYSSCNS